MVPAPDGHLGDVDLELAGRLAQDGLDLLRWLKHNKALIEVFTEAGQGGEGDAAPVAAAEPVSNWRGRRHSQGRGPGAVVARPSPYSRFGPCGPESFPPRICRARKWASQYWAMEGSSGQRHRGIAQSGGTGDLNEVRFVFQPEVPGAVGDSGVDFRGSEPVRDSLLAGKAEMPDILPGRVSFMDAPAVSACSSTTKKIIHPFPAMNRSPAVGLCAWPLHR